MNGNRLIKLAFIFGASSILSATLAFGANHNKKHNPPPTTIAMPHVVGNQIIDEKGNPLILRGGQIYSPLNFVDGWSRGVPVTDFLNPSVFKVMAKDWKMNVLRLPTSNWLYASDPSKYQGILDTVVQEANAAGLYVVIGLFDNVKSGSPYKTGSQVPKKEDITYWQAMATHYKNNPMVIFDLFNEPGSPSWESWLNGGATVNGQQEVGFQAMINAIRATGAKQIIVVEPGNSLSYASIGSYTVNDPNVVYSQHIYKGVLDSAIKQDQSWGPILHNHPIYYGEWALLVNTTPGRCAGVTPSNADQYVNNFMNYMQSRGASWTAWSFRPHYLIDDETNYTPTTFHTAWTCGDPNAHAGMGADVKQYLNR